MSYTIVDIFRSSVLRKRSLVLMVVWYVLTGISTWGCANNPYWQKKVDLNHKRSSSNWFSNRWLINEFLAIFCTVLCNKHQFHSFTFFRVHSLPFFRSTARENSLKLIKFSSQHIMETVCSFHIIISQFCRFSTSLGYYGLTLNISSFAGNKYLNFFISGAMEPFIVLLTMFFYNRCVVVKPVWIKACIIIFNTKNCHELVRQHRFT